VNLGLLAIAIGIGWPSFCIRTKLSLFPLLIGIPWHSRDDDYSDGGADMPTVISLLESYAGLSAAAWALYSAANY